MSMPILMERICQPLHRYTFSAPKIRAWVEAVSSGKVLNLFAGITRLNLTETRVDLDASTNPDFCMDALEFVQQCCDSYDTVILDPPYAYRKSMEKYKGIVASPFRQLKDEIARIVPVNGIVVTFGYHSNSMSKSRGFELSRVCLICHGGAQHDTIAIVETKVKDVELVVTAKSKYLAQSEQIDEDRVPRFLELDLELED